MKKMTKILSLVMVLVLVCCVFASCAKTLSGTYSAETGGTIIGGKISLTFNGKEVTATVGANVVGISAAKDFKGTYEIAEATDGTQTITINFDGTVAGEAAQFGGTQNFSEGKDENGNKTITVGLITLTQVK